MSGRLVDDPRFGRRDNGQIGDEQLARRLQEQEQQLEVDRQFAEALAAGASDGFDEHRLQIAQDYELALQLEAEGSDDGTRIKVEEEEDDSFDAPSAYDQQRSATDTATCTACADDLPRNELATSTCNHAYCATCLSRLFRQAMTDEAYFPPRCCQNEIPLAHAKHFLGPQLAEEFETRAVELTTADRTYCHVSACSAFIPPATIRGDVAWCGSCGQSTCSMCKAAGHLGDCPQDVGLQQTLEEAHRQGWRRCECGRIIELNTGCNHMTCTCRRQFCYLCGARWKTCRCAQWDEQRLYARAEEVINRRPRALAVPRRPCATAFRPEGAVVNAGLPLRDELVREGFDPTDAELLHERDAPLLPACRQRYPLQLHHANPANAQQNDFAQRVRDQNAQQAAQHQHIHAPPQAGPANAQQNNEAHQARVQDVAQQLRENHECRHPQRWRRFKGYHHCPVCAKDKKDVVGECKICFLVACYPCRRHRL
ncbi:uncharacterized protein LTR77_010074 [Saxophila tyrrhenica]|uniref:RBR-type E3 ubiquitin transferase n=1 Tax=Saxophila tyrrhenica TaxID=1690608 RepID=A0AAV9P0Q0_9PEZI|nr:hypothetical protein LTR77_010074 [Saxophila tyrrhenica]